MNAKALSGLPVIDIADGKSLGTVTRAYVDPAARRVVGFAFAQPHGVFAPEVAPRVDADRVHSLGPDALTLDDPAAVQSETIDELAGSLADLDELSSRRVLSEEGVDLGKVSAVEFDEHTFALTRIDVSTGLLKGTTEIEMDRVITIGPDVVVVRAAQGPAAAAHVPPAGA